MNTISTKQFIALCNEYTTVNAAGFFVNYLYTNGYLETISPEYSFAKDLAIDTENVALNITNIKSKKEKIKQIVEFIVHHANMIVDDETCTKEKLLQDITLLLAKENTSVALTNETRTAMANNFKLYDENMVVPKSHPKRDFLLKKVVKPAVITSAVFGTGFGILSKMPIVANSGFFSPNAALATFSWISLGVATGAVGAVAASLAISKLTKNHYKKYCQKGDNLKMLEAAKIESITELNNSTTVLPIKELMTKLYKSNQKIIAYKNGNWWQRNVLSYFHKKWHRNQLWALAAYTQYLRDNSKDLSVTEMQYCKVLMEYIDNNISRDMRDNFAGYTTSYQNLENADIYATIAMGRDKKDNLNAIKNKCHELIKKLTLDHYSNVADTEMFGLVKSIPEGKVLEDITTDTNTQTDTAEQVEENQATAEQQTTTQPETQAVETTEQADTTTDSQTATEKYEQLSIFSASNEITRARRDVRNALEKVKITKYKKSFKIVYTDTTNNKRELVVKRTGDEDIDRTALGSAVANIINAPIAPVETINNEEDMVANL